MKWLIVEDALRDRKGHWLEYVSTFVRGLRALGDEVEVLCDRRAEGFVMEQTGARPVLPESIWHRMGDGAGAVKRYLRVPGHAVATFFAMRKVFRGFNHGLHNRAPRQARDGATEGWPEGRGSGNERVKLTRMGKAQGDAQGTCAGAAFSNPFTSELARDAENSSLTCSASGHASSPGTSYSLPVTAPEAQALDTRLQSGFAGLDLRPDGFGAPFTGVVDSIHWTTIGACDAEDSLIFSYALDGGWIVFTHDLDFGTLLAQTKSNGPSVIQARVEDPTPEIIGFLVLQLLKQFQSELFSGAIVTLAANKRKVRVLPI